MRYENKERATSRQSFRTVMDLGMGVFYVAIGGILIFARKIGMMQIPGIVAYILGAMMVIGGAFRFYRGLRVVLPGKKETDGTSDNAAV